MLYEHFKVDMMLHGVWPKNKVEDVVNLLDWYTNKLRPFMYEFYGIMSAAA
jgi:hypothetical protein